jgi:3-deoxy-D-manno-octulosonate 8-phosphate phosphatase (KDO 8-P phosphatase)
MYLCSMNEALQHIKALLLDVDGVMTNSMIYYDNAGNELKGFNAKDGLMIKALGKLSYHLGVITGRKSDIVHRRMNELQIPFLRQGVLDKMKAYEEFKEMFNLQDREIAYIGDDLNDLKVMRKAGLAVTPNDGAEALKKYCHYTCKTKSGKGVVREFGEILLKAQGNYGRFLQLFDESLKEQ